MRDIILIREKCAFKTLKKPLVQKKSERPQRIQLEREVQNLEEPIMLRAISLNPPLDDADIWIYFSSPTTLLTDWRDLMAHNPFDRTHHRQFSGKQKEIHQQGSFGHRLISLSSTVGACLFLDMWCTQMLPSFWTVEIENTLSSKVLFTLNSSSSIFRLAWFYSDLGRFNCRIILILIYIVQNSMIYILTVGFNKQIRG